MPRIIVDLVCFYLSRLLFFYFDLARNFRCHCQIGFCVRPHCAVFSTGHMEIARVLIQHGARSCLKTECGWTPAHYAAESGQLSVLRLLHSHHAPIDKENCCKLKPVRIAEIYGHQDCVSFLQRYEIKPDPVPSLSTLLPSLLLNICTKQMQLFLNFVSCRAEIECQAYRKMAAENGTSVDDTDDEWPEQTKEN